MQLCWKLEPNERPTFSEIASLLAYTSQPHEKNTSPAVCVDENATDGNSQSEDNEYIEMMCLNDEDVKTDGSRRAERTTHSYLNVNFDSSGEDVGTVRGAALAVVAQTDTNRSNDVFVITNSTATAQSRSQTKQKDGREVDGLVGREECGLLNPPAEKKPLASNYDSTAQNSKEEPEERGEGDGLLDSIIQYFKEKPQAEERQADIDGPLLALQMQDLESSDADSENIQGDIESSSKMLISPTENRIHSSERETPQQQAGNTARVKTGPRQTETEDDCVDPCHPQAGSYIYDECPTTPNVTIAFMTGEKVTPSDTIFAFTPNTSRVIQSTNRIFTERSSSDMFQKRTAATCSNTTPSPSGGGKRYSAVTMTTDRNHVQGWRQRFYSATDYVRMNPAPPS